MGTNKSKNPGLILLDLVPRKLHGFGVWKIGADKTTRGIGPISDLLTNTIFPLTETMLPSVE